MKKLLAFLILLLIIVFAIKNVPLNRIHRGPGYYAECEKNPNPTFTHFVTDLTKVTQIKPPIMKVSSGVKGHSYIDVTERVPVYAPTDSVLVEGVKYKEELGGRGHLDQYSLNFNVSCEVFYFFDHLIELSPKLAEQFPEPPKTTTHTKSTEPIFVKAGEFLGYSAGESAHNFDFGVVNTEQETILADNPEYNFSDKYVHADCPYKYFSDEIRPALYELMGYSNASDLEVIDDLCD